MKETQMNQNNEYAIGASDSIILIISLIGFLFIGIALFHFLLPKRGVPSLLDEDANQEGEEEKELVGGNRAQRKAHARRRAERQREQRRRQMELEAENEEQQNEQNLREHILQQGRRREDGEGEGEGEEDEEDSQNNNHMSKKESKKAIKRAEKQRYRRMEEERRAEIRKKKEAEDAAYLERRALERKEELQLKLKEEQDVNVREAKELKEYNKWKAMFVLEGSSSASALAVDGCINNNDDKYWENVIEFIKQKKIVQVDSVAQKFGLRTEDVMRKLNKMSDLVFDQNSGTFVYMSEELMESLKGYIKEKGSVTSDDLANKIKVLVTST